MTAVRHRRDVAARWVRQAPGAIKAYLARAPGTHVYLLVLLVTTATVDSLHPALADQLLRQVSTNLYQMGRSAWRVLFLSAFLIAGGHWYAEVIAFTVIYVPLERWIGTWRWLLVVVAGHVGATLVTTIGIWADVRSHPGGAALTRAIDVGVSYGFFAAAAFLTFGLPRRSWRIVAATALAGFLLVPLVTHHTFTDAGHVAAMCIGAAMYVVLAPGLRDRPPLLARWSEARVTSRPARSPLAEADTAPSR